MFFGNQFVDIFADQVAECVYLMRQFSIGRPRDEVIQFWSENNRARVTVKDETTFIVHLQKVELFNLICKNPLPGDNIVRAVIFPMPKPFDNLQIKCNESTMKYFLSCPARKLNGKEKRLCQFLAEQRDIGLAYEFADKPSDLPPVPRSIHFTAVQQFALVIIALADGELDLREQEVLMHYNERIFIDGKSPEEKLELVQKIIDFVEQHGVHAAVDFLRQKFIKNPAEVPKAHAELLIKFCLGLAMIDGTVTVNECELILFLGVHALGLQGGKDVGRIFNVTVLEHELMGHDMSSLRAAMDGLSQRLEQLGDA